MSQQVIKQTQNLLGKYVSKPPLTEKLLGKPPFRYLHDIVHVVVNDHGFLKGLFTEEELSSDNIKDKEAKIAFLQKVIDATSLATGENLEVRPNKIVAGHEVERTNLLLQAIAKGIEKQIDSTAAVNQVLSGGATPSKTKKAEKPKPDAKKEKPPVKAKASSKAGDVKRIKDTKSTAAGKTEPEAGSSPAKVGSKPARGAKRTDAATKVPTKGKESKGTAERKAASPRKNAITTKGGDAIPSRDEDTKNLTPSKETNSRGRSVEKEKRDGPKPKPGDPRARKKDESNESKSRVSSKNKSRTPDRAGKKEASKENAPPEPETEVIENIPNGHALPDEIPQSLLPNSGNLRAGTIADNDGPNSLLQTNEDQSEDFFNQDDASQSPQKLRSPDVDPAILKAMRRDGDLADGNQFNEDGNHPSSDSGVGSLESPKPTAKEESLPNATQSKDPSPVPIPPTPGPGVRPISAYHPDLQENLLQEAASFDPSQSADPFERPRTGMGVRPRTGRKSARPPSARPAPPKVRERKEISEDEVPRPPTGKPVANVILDSEARGDDDDDDENFTVGNVQSILDDELSEMPATADSGLDKSKQELLEGDQDAKGILVAQILETKKELEDERKEAFSPETPGHRRVPIEQAFQGDASRRREKEMIQKEVEKLTSSIQALTRSVNPLAKMLDYLQEDLDSMQKELELWRSENKVLTQNLKSEQSLTEQQLEPLKAQLQELESAIFDQQDRISAVKSNMLRNDDRISRLMAGINLNS